MKREPFLMKRLCKGTKKKAIAQKNGQKKDYATLFCPVRLEFWTHVMMNS
jgi:hypothetical protein